MTTGQENKHDFNVGDILEHIWGWEQTNVDFYQVVKVGDRSVWIQGIKSIESVDGQTMTGTAKPLKDEFDGKIRVKRPYKRSYDGKYCLHTKYGCMELWDGEPVRISTYG